jgi:hypothetical protein
MVDQARLDEEWEADKAQIRRPVDVSFRGDDARFEAVLRIAGQFGFSELDRETDEAGDQFLFLECEQAVDEESIRALTRKCLQIELLCGVEYDGWGCQAATGSVH